MKPISYTSDQASDYSKALPKCKSLDELTHLLESYHTIFPDALEHAPMNEGEFIDPVGGEQRAAREADTVRDAIAKLMPPNAPAQAPAKAAHDAGN